MEKALISPEKRQLQGKLTEAFSTYKITKKVEPCSVLKCREGGRDTAVTNCTMEVLTAYKEKNFPVGAMKNRSRLPREVVKSPSVGVDVA